MWQFAGRIRSDERIAYYLADLRDEIAHSFGPPGEVFSPSEYCAASTERVKRNNWPARGPMRQPA